MEDGFVSVGNAAVEQVAPSLLKPNPVNSEIYFEDRERFERLKEEIRADEGVREALIAEKGTMVVLDGNQRLKVALALELKTVPVVYVTVKDHAALVQHSIVHNCRKRKLTPSELFKAINLVWKGVEQEVHSGVGYMSRGKQAARTRDRVGALVCIDGRHAERYHKAMQDLLKYDAEAWQKIQQMPDCFEEACRIIREHRATESAKSAGAAAVIAKALRALQAAVVEAEKLPGIAREMRPVEEVELLFDLAARLSAVAEEVVRVKS